MVNKALKMGSDVLLLAGGINWGVVGLFGTNLVESLLGTGVLTKVVYIGVGLSALWKLWVMVMKD